MSTDHPAPPRHQVCCNLSDLTHPSFVHPAVPYVLPAAHTNPLSLEAAVTAAADALGAATKVSDAAG